MPGRVEGCVVVGVLAEALREAGCSRIVASGEGPEAELLRQWLKGSGIEFLRPAREALEAARTLIAAARQAADTSTRCAEGHPAEAAVGRLAAAALSAAAGALWVGTQNKTYLLLDPVPSWEPVLPLGDLYASRVLELIGKCTLPPPFEGLGPEAVRAVDEALKDYLEGGQPLERALGRVPAALRGKIAFVLSEGSTRRGRPPLIPKLGGATLGVDLDL